MVDSLFGASSAFSAGLLSTFSSPTTHAMHQVLSCLDTGAAIYFPGSQEFLDASARWNAAQTPQYDVIVKAATEADVQKTVR